MSRVTFRHGPVTITVDGLPESVLSAAVHLELGVHYAYHAEADRDAAFAADFAAFGGSELFAEASGSSRFSARHVARAGGGATSKLQLYAPAPYDDVESPALAAALAGEARDRQGGMPVAPECSGACVCVPACDVFAPCERLQP